MMACPMNNDEVRALAIFKQVVEDLNLEDGTLMRFLRARNLDIKVAEKNLRNSELWRSSSSISVDSMRDDWKPPRKMFEHFNRAFVCGEDLEDRLVIFVKLDELLPIRPLYDTYEPIDFLMFGFQIHNRVCEYIKSTKHQQVNLIVDIESIGFRKAFHELNFWTGMKTLNELAQLIELNFPETLHKMFIIKAARAGVWGFNIIRPLLPGYTRDKIQIFGSDREEFIPVIQDCLPHNVIPQELGGSAKLTPLFDLMF